MAKSKTSVPATANGRGSPEAIAKRRSARRLNEFFAGGRKMAEAKPLDGRTERRRKRLYTELGSSAGSQARSTMKPIALLQRIHELFVMGETLGAVRKAVKVRSARIPLETAADTLREVHSTYGFHPDAYRFLGLSDDVLVDAGVRAPGPARRGRRPRYVPPT